MVQIKKLIVGFLGALLFASLSMAQELPKSQAISGQGLAERQTDQPTQIATGRKLKVSGVIIELNSEALVVRDEIGATVKVVLTDHTMVRQKKKNIFGHSTSYPAQRLLRGLFIDLEGRTNNSGYIVAENIRFSKRALMIASAIGSRLDPVEQRISANEAIAEEQAFQIEESNAAAKAALKNARDAKGLAKAAIVGYAGIVTGIDDVISNLDQYAVTKRIAVNFTSSSATLSPQARAGLNEIAEEARSREGYLIEVKGYASSEGNVDQNRQLSRRRAEAVVAYLVGTHMIPPRRIVAPVGLGSANQIADDSSREGREQNRRVEVKILVNRGLGSTDPDGRQ
jgi:outer membrane protein OmpA-like peptidoglycan-associated protein